MKTLIKNATLVNENELQVADLLIEGELIWEREQVSYPDFDLHIPNEWKRYQLLN